MPRIDPVPLPIGEVVSRHGGIGSSLFGSMTFDFALQNVSPIERWSPETVCTNWNGVRANLVDGVWSGGNLSPDPADPSTCVVGDNPQSRNSMLSLVNLYRGLAGVQAVGTDPALDAAAQACAYAHYLHSPPPQDPVLCHNEDAGPACVDFLGWTCNTDAAQTAAGSAGSNLAWPGDVGAIDRFMVDSVNSGLGHRLPIISSGLGDIGIGSTQSGSTEGYLCMQQNARPDGIPRRSWTAWPPPGPVPLQVFELRSAGSNPRVLDEAGWSIQTDRMITLALESLEPYASATVVDETGETLQITPVEALRQDVLRFRPDGWETVAGKTYTVTWTPNSDRHQPQIRYTVTPIDCGP